MKRVRGNSVQDRLDDQKKAKQQLLDRLKKMPGPNDPEMVARRAARAEAARERQMERERRAAERAEAERKHREDEAAEKARLLEIEAQRAREEADRQVAILAEQKAKRDARYAARKKRRVKV